MTANEYQQALKKAKGELDQYLRQRGEIDRKIVHLKSTVEALSALCEEQDFSIPPDIEFPKSFGITMRIRKVLSESAVPLSAVQIRDALANSGIEMKEYANEMAVIHNTLKRLIEQGEIMTVRNAAGQIAGYAEIPRMPPAPVAGLRMPPAGVPTEPSLQAGLPPPPGYRPRHVIVRPKK